MSIARYYLSLVLSVVLISLAWAAAPPTGPLPSQIALWVEELGDDSFAVRQEASKKLRAAGRAAEAALENAVSTSKDAEVIRRARVILADFRWGVYPDTPDAIVELIRKYQASARHEKREVIRKLLAAGSPGCRALVKIARAEEDPLVRKEVFTDVASTLSRSVPALLEKNDLDSLDSLLELALAGDVRTSIGHYAAFHLLRGRLPARIAAWEARAKLAVVPKAENEVLAYLHRANGDLDKARAAAAEAERTDLVEAFLYEKADWKELARRPELVDMTFWPRGAGYKAAYARLTGDSKAFADLIEDIRKRGRETADGRGDVLPYAKALFLNGESADAIDLLSKNESNAKMLYEILTAQLKYKEAFALVEEARMAGRADLPTLELLQARTLHYLGEKDKAKALVKKYADQLAPGTRGGWLADLVESELSVGGRDAAFTLAGKVLSIATDEGWADRVFRKLFESRTAEEARVLWDLLVRVRPMEKAPDRLMRVRKLVEGKASEKELTEALDFRIAGKLSEEEKRVLGEMAVLGKKPEHAREFFRDAGTVRAWIRLGDLLADKKQWLPAAVQYEAAYRLGIKADAPPRGEDEGEGLPALALYLSGNALVQAGRTDEGKARIDRAHLLPLGDAEMRFDLARALLRRGHMEAANREQDLLRRLGEPVLLEPMSYYTGEGLRGAAFTAAQRKQWLKAADGFEQTFLRCLNPSMNFQRPPAYVLVPAFIYLNRSRGLVAAGKYDEAKREIDRLRSCAPGNIDVVLHLVPELDRLGRKKDADALFKEVQSTFTRVIKAYPQSGWALNQAAWLSATCRRDLAQGLEYARKATEVAPDSAAYHDTMAEVLFQLGKKDEAIAMQKKAIRLQPERKYFQKQLKRIEAGDPKAPRPEENDE